MSIFLVIALVFYSIYRLNDSITKYRRIEIEAFIRNHPELNIINCDINKSNAYIEIANEKELVYVSIFNKKLNLREKIAFSTYCILPLIAALLQNAFAGYAIKVE